MKLVPIAAVGLAATIVLTTTAAPSDAAAQQQRSRICNVDHVAVIHARMHIKCAANQGQAYTQDIPYYAMNLRGNNTKVQSIIALAVGAKETRKPLRIWFDQADYESVPGCQGSNCRVLLGAALE